MTDLDLYSEIIVEDNEKRFENLANFEPERVSSLQAQCSFLEAEVEALNAHVSRLEKERLALIATKDQITDNFSRLGLACRKEIEKLKVQMKVICSKYKIPEPMAISRRKLSCETQINPEKQNYYTDLVAYLHADPLPANIYPNSNVSSKSPGVMSKRDAFTQTERFIRHSSPSSASSFGSVSSRSISSSSSSSSTSSSSSSSQDQPPSHVALVNNDAMSNFTDQSVDDRQVLSLSRPALVINPKKLERCGCRDPVRRETHDRTCELSKYKQEDSFPKHLLAAKRLYSCERRSRERYAPKSGVKNQGPVGNARSGKYAKEISGRFSLKPHCFHQSKLKEHRNNHEIVNDSMRKSNISTETQMLSLHRVKAFSSPKRENIDQPSSIKNSTVKDSQNLQIDQHRSQCLRTGSPSKVKDSCTGPDSSSRNSVSSQLLKAVENAVRSSRDHHAIRRQHVSANVAHRNRYPRLLCRTNQVPVEVSGMRSGDCSSEPETQSREASCTLYAVRAHSKGNRKNMVVESTSQDLTDAGHRAVKDNEQLTCNQNSTLNALIPDSSNNIGDIHSLGDHSTQEVELASNEPVTNSFHHSGQSSTHFSPKNDSFYSVENKSADLDIPEVLGLTPPISHEQEFTEDRTDTPSIRKKLSQSEDTCNDVKDNESRAVCTECSTHSRCNSLSNHSEEESNHSQRFRKTAENQKEEGEIADDVDEDDYADVFNSSASHISQTRKRCWSRSSPVIHKTPKLCSERQTMDSATSQVSPDLKNAPPYPKRVQRRSSRSSQHYSEKDGSRNSSSGFVDLSYRASPGCEDRHSPNVVTTRFSHSPERRHRGSRYNSSISRSPSMKHSRGEYHNDPYRSSNSRSKNHPSRRRYKSPEINGRDFNLGKHDRSTISSNSPRRRFRHSPAPPNNPNSSYRRFERDRMTRDNRRFRAFSPALNRNPHHRLGINSSKVSGSRFNRVHHQRRF